MFQFLLVTISSYLLKVIINTSLFLSIASSHCRLETHVLGWTGTRTLSRPIRRFHLWWSISWYLGIALWRYIGIVWPVLGQAIVGIPKFLQQLRYNLETSMDVQYISCFIRKGSHGGEAGGKDPTRPVVHLTTYGSVCIYAGKAPPRSFHAVWTSTKRS